MSGISLLQILFYFLIILACVIPVGTYIAYVYEGKLHFLNTIEKLIYRFAHVNKNEDMNWQHYLSAMLLINLVGILVVYVLQRVQSYLPLNPEHFGNVEPLLAFNTAVSFATNTNWQAYVGENSLSYFTQMLGLTVQNFLSAATGMALAVAFIRGLSRHEKNGLGNFWVDLVRGILYIFLPLAMVLAILLNSQGVIQNFKSYVKIHSYASNVEQVIPMGPVASQVAIKQLGSNGGGFFNANSAHPFENPTPLTNFFEMLAILLIPAAMFYTFGVMMKDQRQGWAIFLAVLIIFLPLLLITEFVEQYGNPFFSALNIDQIEQPDVMSGGNMEGKEVRFGIVNSALWAGLTTATGNGSVNSMHDSYIPLGGQNPLTLMHLDDVVFGSVGTGLYRMLLVIIVTVFITGLMVGRTPEYLGKKIEPYEMKMTAFSVLMMPLIALCCTAFASVSTMGTSSITNPGPHGFTQILYAFTSLANNNGSAFAGLHTNTPFYNLLGGLAMLVARFWIAIPMLAIAGSLVRKKIIPSTAGTLPTHTPLFITLLICVTVMLGALTFLPALALGPIVEQILLWGPHGQ